MTRVVVSAGYGGFALSDDALRRLAALGHDAPERLPRDHPDLVAVVEELGDAAGAPQPLLKGSPSQPLAIVEVPGDVDWVIKEYDGAEWVAERHRRWDAGGELPLGQRVRVRMPGEGAG